MRILKLSFAAIAFSLILNSCSSNKVTKVVTKEVDLAPAVTPDAKELTRMSDDDLQNFYPALSPDGKRLLYQTNNPDQTGDKSVHLDLKVIGAQGTTALLTEGCSSPSWMPDSKEFFFTYSVPSKPVIAKSKTDQGGIKYVSPNSNGDNDDGAGFLTGMNKVLFQTKIGANTQLCTMDTNGLNFTLLGTGQNPFPHPKDKAFVFDKKIGNHYQIFLYDLESGQQTQLTSGESDHHSPKYSPDGKWIVYVKSESDKTGTTTSSHLFLMNGGGGDVRQLTTGNTWNITPSFGADGFIYFSSNAGSNNKKSWQNFDIWRLRPSL
jgi:TolB protein